MSTDTQSGTGNTSANTNDGNTGNTSDQNTNEGNSSVTMSQEDLNSLINGKFAKGAEKATKELLSNLGVDNAEQLKEIIEAKKQQDEANKTELEKLTDEINSLKTLNESLTKEKDKASTTATINSLAVKHGIKDVEYFTFALKQEQGGEDFNEDTFIENLKKSKPYVFGEKPNTDNSSNGNGVTNTFEDKLKGLSFNDLRKLQANI